MMDIRRSEARGHIDHGWLDTRHTFSFGHYHDPAFMGFRSLRVINEDFVMGGEGFGKHFHDDMEILTYVLEGAVEHKDNTGGGGVIRPGDVQRMTAGRGIIHSEFNHSKDERLHLLQIWIVPERSGLDPSYEDRTFGPLLDGSLTLIASRDGREGSLRINQDADVRAGRLPAGFTTTFALGDDRGMWLQVARGTIEVNGETLHAGDGAAIQKEPSVTVVVRDSAEILMFDLA